MLELIKQLVRGVGLFAIFSAIGCTASHSGAEAEKWSDLSVETTEHLQSIIGQTMTENGVVGYSIAVLRDGDVVYKTHGGFANIEHQVPITSESRYQIYSASKLFFNVALMQLVERDQLNLDMTVGDYLSDMPEAWRDITVRQVWSHMTGIADILDLTGMEPTPEEALQSVKDTSLRFIPGTQTEYNQTNYLILKNIFEAITDTDYRDYLENVLLAPIGLRDIPLGDLSFVALHLTTHYEAHAHEAGALGRRAMKFPPYIYTSAGLNLTLDEFITWWSAVLDETYVSASTLHKFWEPVMLSGGQASYRSYGWERRYKDKILRVGHGGGGRIHLFHYVPDEASAPRVTVIFLNNGGMKYFNHRGLGDALANVVLQAR